MAAGDDEDTCTSPRREVIHSMLRRLIGWDYRQRAIYQITITLADRASQALGHLEVKGLDGTWRPIREMKGAGIAPEAIVARVVPSEVGRLVAQCWAEIPRQWPGVSVIGAQIMPDHFHGIIFIERPQVKALGNIIGSFKSRSTSLAARGQARDEAARGQARDEAARDQARDEAGLIGCEAIGGQAGNVAAGGQIGREAMGGQVGNVAAGGLVAHGGGYCARPRAASLWAPGYQDTILFREGQLAIMKHYLLDNPRRLAIKRLFPDLFKVVGELAVPLTLPGDSAGMGHFAALGNRFLLARPLAQVQVSRRDFAYQREPKAGGGLKIARDALGSPLIASSSPIYAEKKAALFAAAKHGAVLISPCISDGERQIAREALQAGLPLITMLNKGFSKLQKPSGRHFDACAEGRLLMLAPGAWPYQPGEKPMTRMDATAMNRLCQWIVGADAVEINYHGMQPANIDALALAAACVDRRE